VAGKRRKTHLSAAGRPRGPVGPWEADRLVGIWCSLGQRQRRVEDQQGQSAFGVGCRHRHRHRHLVYAPGSIHTDDLNAASSCGRRRSGPPRSTMDDDVSTAWRCSLATPLRFHFHVPSC
jgi:hypothetical protein